MVRLHSAKRFLLGFVVFLTSTLSMGGALMAVESTKFNKAFFDEVEPIKLEDPLAVVLGAIDKGEPMVYTYGDAVRLAGHSCPAISGAYKLTQLALKELYPDKTPVRSEITVKFKGGVEDKVNGPISQVISFITGAAPESGFRGLGAGKYNRKNLLTYDENDAPSPDCICSVVFQRTDTGKKIEITYSNYMLPADPRMGELMPKAVSGRASDSELKEFGELWHERIKTILFNPPEGMFVIKELK
ncbi:MAG: FmdE family protein [Candidatus Brocadiales bacterium]